MNHSKIIVGIGNTLRGDDGVAAELLDRLGAKTISSDVVCLHQLAIESAEMISHYADVLFVDASVALEPGHWKCETIEARGDADPRISHSMTPHSVVKLARQLYGKNVNSYVLSVGAGHFDLLQGFSQEVEVAIPSIAEFVRQWSCTPRSSDERAEALQTCSNAH